MNDIDITLVCVLMNEHPQASSHTVSHPLFTSFEMESLAYLDVCSFSVFGTMENEFETF